jgi:hypothetical protein
VVRVYLKDHVTLGLTPGGEAEITPRGTCHVGGRVSEATECNHSSGVDRFVEHVGHNQVATGCIAASGWPH